MSATVRARVAAVLALLACGCASKRDVAPPPALADVLAAARAAYADATWPEGRALLASGPARSSGATGAFRLELHGAGRFRLELDGPVRTVRAFDGHVGWTRDGDGPARRLVLRERDAHVAWIRALDGSWADAAAPLVRIAGRAPDGASSVALEAPGTAATTGLELDPASGLPRALRERARGRTTAWSLTGWRHRADRALPERIAFEGNADVGTRLELAEVRWIDADPHRLVPPSGADDARFEPDVPDVVHCRRGPTGHLFAPLSIDGGAPRWFLVDTGASGVVVDDDVARAAGLPTVGAVGAVGGGGRRFARLVRAGAWTLGPLTVDTPVLLAIDLGGFSAHLDEELAGIVGWDLFARAAVALPAAGEEPVLRVRPPGGFVADVAPGAWEPVLAPDGVACVRATVEGRGDGWFLLDTGAAWTVALHTPSLERLGLPDGRPWTSGAARGVATSTRTRVGTLGRLELGGRTLHDVDVHLALAREGSLADEVLTGNLGLGALAPFRTVLDLAHERYALLDP